jgi:predicted dehydrogenase
VCQQEVEMTDTLRVGLVGADAAGRGWAPTAHIPAIEAVEGIELGAVCTRSAESAAAASKAYGVPGFHDVAEMAAQPDIDIVSVVVKVPGHHGAVMAALEAGKHVYCEWPLGLDAAEAEEMAVLARARGVVSAVGLQGRQDPTLAYIRELISEGWLGDVLAVDVRMLAGAGPRGEQRPAAVPGATLWAIAGGHTLDSVSHLFGPLERVSATMTTSAGADGDPASPDHAVIAGRLANGGLLSYRLAAVPHHASGWRMEVHGSDGTIVASSRLLPQITPIELVGSQGDAPLVEMPVPDRHRVVPTTLPEGPARNVARAYARMAESIRDGSPFPAGFDDAVALHRLLETIERAPSR